MSFYQTLKKIALPGNDARPLFFILSIALSLLWYSYGRTINIDGVNYIYNAREFLNHGVSYMLHHFNWPMYSILIGSVSKVLGISFYHAALTINAFLFALATVAFISITKNLGFNLNVQILAGLVILLYPKLANERDFIFRDFGYYALMLCAFNALVIFYNKEKFLWLLAWLVLTIFAALFRIEGFAFLVTLPFFSLFCCSEQKLTFVLKNFAIYGLFLVLAVVGYFILSHSQHYAHFFQHSFDNDYVYVFQRIFQGYNHTKDLMQTQILSIFAERFAGTILISGAIGIVLLTLLKSMLPVHWFLTGYGWYKESGNLRYNHRWLFAGYFLTYFIILTGFSLQRLFLTDRYVLMWSLLLFLLIAPAIEAFYRNNVKNLHWRHPAAYLSSLFVIAFLVMLVGSIVHVGVDKRYIIKGAEWVNQNTAKTARVYLASPKMTFYVKRAGTEFPQDFPYGKQFTLAEQIQKIKNGQFNYAMLAINKAQLKEALATTKAAGLTLVASFKNNRDDAVMIFKAR